jgi:hypothetical protein
MTHSKYFLALITYMCMKAWRKWLTCLLVLALPLAGNAGIWLQSHCNHTERTVISAPDQALTDHCASKKDSHKSIKHDSDTGQCNCTNHVACASPGISNAAISNYSINYRINRTHLLTHANITPLVSLEQHYIFRPPISIF